ncbi:hypothetical protein [Pseudomonas putida]|uniref:hypothetical protein n=1 Tax=Pseudomonas putida TaxID=303 RepID=UPI001BAFAC07|nr:hypothetical protein [Pseudomonas putida]
MKKTLLAIALSTTAFTSIAHAEFIYKLPLEIKGGGSLPNGSITFNNKAAPVDPTTPSEPETPVEPTEPTEPEIVDPFEPENPECDPLAQGYPANSIGKEYDFAAGWIDENGVRYAACKLKSEPEDKLLVKFVDGFGLGNDYCNPSNQTNTLSSASCIVGSSYFVSTFKPTFSDGGYKYSYTRTIVQIPSGKGFTFAEIGKIEIDGKECSNPRSVNITPMWKANVCDLGLSYEQLKEKTYKPYIVKIYSK